MSRKVEKSVIQRYRLPVVVDHLASNYVMGLLNNNVRQRVEALRRDINYPQLDERISYWEQKFSPLNDETPELAPLPETWQDLQKRLNIGQHQQSQNQQAEQRQNNERGRSNKFMWSRFFTLQWPSAVTIAFCFAIGIFLVNDPTPTDPLSYVAVLQDSNKTPQVVAATYGDSKNLVLEIIELPDIDSQESFELWVTSKTDNQTRSLGAVPRNLASYQRQLSDAEWRLIVDSAYLIISVEEEGGSAIGEPSETVVSRGVCIQLSGWEAQS